MISYAFNWMERDGIDSFHTRNIGFYSQQQQKWSEEDKKARKLQKPFCSWVLFAENLDKFSTRSDDTIYFHS